MHETAPAAHQQQNTSYQATPSSHTALSTKLNATNTVKSLQLRSEQLQQPRARHEGIQNSTPSVVTQRLVSYSGNEDEKLTLQDGVETCESANGDAKQIIFPIRTDADNHMKFSAETLGNDAADTSTVGKTIVINVNKDDANNTKVDFKKSYLVSTLLHEIILHGKSEYDVLANGATASSASQDHRNIENWKKFLVDSKNINEDTLLDSIEDALNHRDEMQGDEVIEIQKAADEIIGNTAIVKSGTWSEHNVKMTFGERVMDEN